jgi:TRAP-type C4-dicarboxylate transport system substrate-binding protein
MYIHMYIYIYIHIYVYICIYRERVIEKKDAFERINQEEQRLFMAEYEDKGQFVRQQNEALEESLLRERKDDAVYMCIYTYVYI